MKTKQTLALVLAVCAAAKRKIKRTLLKKREKRWTEARKPRDPESPKGFPGGLTQRP